jgi:hypothetical protein
MELMYRCTVWVSDEPIEYGHESNAPCERRNVDEGVRLVRRGDIVECIFHHMHRGSRGQIQEII